jgi:hypothetical protein
MWSLLPIVGLLLGVVLLFLLSFQPTDRPKENFARNIIEFFV